MSSVKRYLLPQRQIASRWATSGRSNRLGVSQIQTVIIVLGVIVTVLVAVMVAAMLLSPPYVTIPIGFPAIQDVREEVDSKEFTVMASTVRLQFSTFNGQIVLQSTDSDKLTIRITKRGTAEGLANIVIESGSEIGPNGIQNISLIAQRLNTMLSNTQEGVQLEVQVPIRASYSLNLESSNGGIEISQLRGTELTGRTSNGRMTLNNIDFTRVEAQTSNGRIDGIIRSDEASIQTSNGRIDLTIIGAGDYSLQTSNGQIDVNLRDDLPTKVDARTSNSDVEWVGTQFTISQSQKGILVAQTENFDEADSRIDLLLQTSNSRITVISND